jgi:membrane protease YdiL (CAAX protease family)
LSELLFVDEGRTKPWGFWATIGFSALIFVVFSALQFLVLMAFLAFERAHHPPVDPDAFVQSLSSNGFCLALSAILSGLVCTPLTLFIAKLRKNYPLKEYLALKGVSKREWLKWLLYLVIFLAASDGLTLLLNRPIVPPFMADAYRTATFVPALYIAIVIVAPIFEEIFFRGFLFEGVRHSRLGPGGAIGMTSLVWAIIHVQYDTYGVSTVFALGLLFGFARLKLESVYVPVVMHALASFVAMIETAIYVRFGG